MDDPLLTEEARGDTGAVEVVELHLSGTRWDIRLSAVHDSISRLRALIEAN